MEKKQLKPEEYDEDRKKAMEEIKNDKKVVPTPLDRAIEYIESIAKTSKERKKIAGDCYRHFLEQSRK